MFAFILIGYSVFHLAESNVILTNPSDADASVVNAFGKGVSLNETNLMVRRLSQVPFTEIFKYNIWSKLSLEKRLEKLPPSEWVKFESLIPYIPFSFFEKINVTDNSVLRFFGQSKLSKPQLTKLAEYILLDNPHVLEDEEKLEVIGNIVCGFHPKKIQSIKEPVLRSLIKTNFFQKIKSCDAKQLRHLLTSVKKHSVIGPPRIWRPNIVKRVGILVSGLTVPEIREIQEVSFSQITFEVIESAPVKLLKSVRDSQLKTLSKRALLSWRRKTQDLRHLYHNSGNFLEVSLSSAKFTFILSNTFLIYMRNLWQMS